MADPVLLGRLLAALDGRGVVARRILRDELGVTDDALRAAVRYSRGQVCSLSRRGGGYSLTVQTPAGDAQHSVSELLSRAHQLKMRAAEIVAAINRRGGKGGGR